LGTVCFPELYSRLKAATNPTVVFKLNVPWKLLSQCVVADDILTRVVGVENKQIGLFSMGISFFYSHTAVKSFTKNTL
jgi:hypothetical protein